MSEQCSNCRFFRRFEGRDAICRRHAPRPLNALDPDGVKPGDLYFSPWPFVDGDDWCGEWESAKLPIDTVAKTPESTLANLPTPEEIHAELVATLARAETLRKLFRVSQRAERERPKTKDNEG